MGTRKLSGKPDEMLGRFFYLFFIYFFLIYLFRVQYDYNLQLNTNYFALINLQYTTYNTVIQYILLLTV